MSGWVLVCIDLTAWDWWSHHNTLQLTNWVTEVQRMQGKLWNARKTFIGCVYLVLSLRLYHRLGWIFGLHGLAIPEVSEPAEKSHVSVLTMSLWYQCQWHWQKMVNFGGLSEIGSFSSINLSFVDIWGPGIIITREEGLFDRSRCFAILAKSPSGSGRCSKTSRDWSIQQWLKDNKREQWRVMPPPNEYQPDTQGWTAQKYKGLWKCNSPYSLKMLHLACVSSRYLFAYSWTFLPIADLNWDTSEDAEVTVEGGFRDTCCRGSFHGRFHFACLWASSSPCLLDFWPWLQGRDNSGMTDSSCSKKTKHRGNHTPQSQSFAK